MMSRLDELTIAQDAVLVVDSCAGDVSAFAELYERHYPRVLRTVRRRVQSDAIAEDLTQEVFTEAFAGLHRLRRPERFYPWLAAIARYKVARHHRLAARLCLIADVDMGRSSEGPESQLLRRLDEDNLNAAMGRVRGRHRDILTMREDEGLSYEEIAERLGMPVSTVTSLLFRARQALRREYLAITGTNTTFASVPTLAAVAGAVRRFRDRFAHYAVVAPDSTVLVGSAVMMTTLAMSVTSLLGVAESNPVNSSTAATVSFPQMEAVDRRAAHHSAHAPTLDRPKRSARVWSSPPAPPSTVVRSDVAEFGVNDDEGARRARDRASQWPILFDGPVGFGVNPEPLWEDIESATN